MTAGSEHLIPNHHAIHPRDDRETLSALFDGELPGDAARFALKRLDHDVSWRETCGRWQLIGDALRGQATTMAPSDFAAGVMRALDIEGMAATVATSATSAAASDHASAQAVASPRRRWIGGAALAASVAMAAILVVRPLSQDTSQDATSTPDAQVAVSAAPAVSTQTPAVTEPAASAGSTNTISAGSAAAAAVAAASRPSSARRIGNPRGAQRLSQRHSVPDELPSSAPALEVAVAAATTHQQPFHPSGDEVTTRPWPRAVLPDTAASGALTVGFGTSSTPSPSFYPFEPRLPTSEAQPVNESQH
ncbi:MAG TPA: sigma-E factor negative regulatory protein [Lysobacter sp.]|jgi:negative regulator of sigma E activity|nr:sigma-E factor negative regulatory protein [Lysobacter sp.]